MACCMLSPVLYGLVLCLCQVWGQVRTLMEKNASLEMTKRNLEEEMERVRSVVLFLQEKLGSKLCPIPSCKNNILIPNSYRNCPNVKLKQVCKNLSRIYYLKDIFFHVLLCHNCHVVFIVLLNYFYPCFINRDFCSQTYFHA